MKQLALRMIPERSHRNSKVLFAIVHVLSLCVLQTSMAVADDKLDKIRQRGTLIWGADQEGGGPFVYPDPNDPTQRIGFEVELAELIAEHIGVKAEFSQGQWDKLPDLLDRGDIMGCRKSLEENAGFLDLNAKKFDSETLNELARENRDQVERLQGVTSNAAPAAQSARKSMRGYQYESDSQQSKSAKP